MPTRVIEAFRGFPVEDRRAGAHAGDAYTGIARPGRCVRGRLGPMGYLPAWLPGQGVFLGTFVLAEYACRSPGP